MANCCDCIVNYLYMYSIVLDGMSHQYFRIVEHWYPEDFPYDTDEESIERLNSVVPGTWEYMISHDEDPGIYLLEYVGELEDG